MKADSYQLQMLAVRAAAAEEMPPVRVEDQGPNKLNDAGRRGAAPDSRERAEVECGRLRRLIRARPREGESSRG